jgi:hypothetical protein
MLDPQHLTTLCASTACYSDTFTFPYIYGVRIPQETHLWDSMASYGESFTFLYVDYVRTSQETNLWIPTACYGNSFTFPYIDVFVPHRKHTYGPPRRLMQMALIFICRWCSYLTGNTYEPLWPIAGIGLQLLYTIIVFSFSNSVSVGLWRSPRLIEDVLKVEMSPCLPSVPVANRQKRFGNLSATGRQRRGTLWLS